MANPFILYALAAVIFFPLDFVWLSTVGRSVYRRQLGDLLLPRPKLLIAGLFYLAYLIGLVVLVAIPADGNVLKALAMGGVLGFVAYGTYDLTNLSTVRGFTPIVAAIDMAWGTALTAVTAAGAVWTARMFA
jgi:uncharacterized membrane protein